MAARQFFAGSQECHHLFLALVESGFNGRRNESRCSRRNLQPVIVAIRAGERDDEIAVLLGEGRGVEAVVDRRRRALQWTRRARRNKSVVQCVDESIESIVSPLIVSPPICPKEINAETESQLGDAPKNPPNHS